MTLPVSVDTFGYGYALLGTGTILNGTIISLFNGATPVGSLSYTATPDPSLPRGFAGIQSKLAFNRIEATSTVFRRLPSLSITFAGVPQFPFRANDPYATWHWCVRNDSSSRSS
jgi:hypothetical protein